MSKKNTRNALDTSLSYAVIGLDPAKADCAVAAVTCSDDELGLIDRMDYESLFEQAYFFRVRVSARRKPARCVPPSMVLMLFT